MTSRFSILIITLILNLGAMTACRSTEKTSFGNEAIVDGAEQAQTNAVNKTTKDKPLKEDSAMTQDGLPELKKGEDYLKSVREKMLKAGWKPARSNAADWCGSQEIVCDKFDEYEASTGKSLISFRWQKGDKVVEILTTGETQVPDSGYAYDHYEFEKNSMTIVQNERWEEFWNDFKTALNKRDKEKLKYLMADNIDGGGAPETSEERIAAIEKSDMWASMQKTVAEGTKIDKCNKPCRISKDGYLVFTYEMASWKWSGLGGEGGGD